MSGQLATKGKRAAIYIRKSQVYKGVRYISPEMQREACVRWSEEEGYAYEVFADVEKHIARWEPHIKALYAYDPESARAEAKASTDRWAKGAPKGPLDGVPVTVKENIASCSSPICAMCFQTTGSHIFQPV